MLMSTGFSSIVQFVFDSLSYVPLATAAQLFSQSGHQSAQSQSGEAISLCFTLPCQVCAGSITPRCLQSSWRDLSSAFVSSRNTLGASLGTPPGRPDGRYLPGTGTVSKLAASRDVSPRCLRASLELSPLSLELSPRRLLSLGGLLRCLRTSRLTTLDV